MNTSIEKKQNKVFVSTKAAKPQTKYVDNIVKPVADVLNRACEEVIQILSGFENKTDSNTKHLK